MDWVGIGEGFTTAGCIVPFDGSNLRFYQDSLIFDVDSQHAGYIRNKNLSQPTGKHFNGRGHSLSDMSFVILEKVFNKDVLLREERESHYIRLFNSKYKGMNVKN